jgi:exosome complex component MTR3
MEFSQKGKLVCELKFCPNSVRGERKKYQQDKEERELSIMLTQSLEHSVILDKFPKSVIDIYVLVLESDGSVLSASISCASLAIVSAGIECFDLVAACSSSVVSCIFVCLLSVYGC